MILRWGYKISSQPPLLVPFPATDQKVHNQEKNNPDAYKLSEIQ
ncbi:hypothetical protein Pryu01_01840 [Paraliobacillus ryukyuensis]|uniref:Uncharacterized protein n=1 Tax=Paraliobacillus ryukyuensis TaxID=200904 RepID=A0A366DVC5_9BACI|nr:hypothetical protein [Paraliobacillus ryukyuensis]RBO93194.1 hypothetical protein DES48_11360 [Paraliobacillus ryukyuensis]